MLMWAWLGARHGQVWDGRWVSAGNSGQLVTRAARDDACILVYDTEGTWGCRARDAMQCVHTQACP